MEGKSNVTKDTRWLGQPLDVTIVDQGHDWA